MAGSLAALGQLSEAARVADEALAINPDHESLRQARAYW
jgi:hypothetical protein